MKKTLLALTALIATLAVSGCSTTIGPAPHYETVAGYPFKTNLSCKRTVPVGKFDPECDYPLLGYKGFSADPGFSVGSAGGGGPG